VVQRSDTWEIVTDPQALLALADEWNDLWVRAGSEYVSQRFGWCWAAWTNVAQPLGRRLHCVVARRDGKAVLIWPFVVFRFGIWKRARPLGPEVAEYTSVLVEDDEHADARVATAWRTLCRTIRCDSILLPFVPAGSRLHRFMSGTRHVMVTQSTPLSSTRCDDEADRERIARMFHSKSLAKHRRRLGDHGEVRFERIDDVSRRVDLIDWTLHHKEAMLERTGGRPIWHRTKLYRDFLAAVAAEDGFELFALTVDGAPVSTCVARVDRVRFEQFLSAYDNRFAEFSPGQLLRVEDMRWVLDRGLVYDLRVGEHGYKKEWTNRQSEAISYNVANSPWGAIAIGAREAQLAIRHAAVVRKPAVRA